MRQSITTKFIGPTNSRGARIKAIARKADSIGSEMSVTVPFEYIGTDKAHTAAARVCAEKYNWFGLWVGGGNVDGTGNVYVNVGAPSTELPDSMGQEDSDWFYVVPKNSD